MHCCLLGFRSQVDYLIINWEDDHCDLDGYDDDYYDYYCDSDDYYYVILEMVSRIIMISILLIILIMIRRFRLAMHDMIGYYPSYFFVACWSVITPAICAGVFFFKVLIVLFVIIVVLVLIIIMR